ncbi:MAG: hypothetical protein WC415_01390 [Patescibacteria group bacterium]
MNENPIIYININAGMYIINGNRSIFAPSISYDYCNANYDGCFYNDAG